MSRHNLTNVTPPPDELLNLIFYEDGHLYWTKAAIKEKPRRKAGPIGHVTPAGYRQTLISVGGVKRHFYLHRLIYWFHTGEWPETVDHKDQNKQNNRIENLRPATRKQQEHNKSSRGETNYFGVNYNKENKTYRATIAIDGKQQIITGFKTPEMAALHRDILATLFHGEFASLNILNKPFKTTHDKAAGIKARAKFNALIESVKQP
ncbi:HNH endonuclease [Enterobacteriaceae bacterium G50]|nr:HNH endonuclease [Enterobacteriaceae bacterium G50]